MGLRQAWQRFASAPVGERFQAHFHNHDGHGASLFRKPLILFIGSLMLVAGLVMLFTPGPGVLALVMGAALLAREWLWLARLLDRCDVAARRLGRACRSLWGKSGLWLKGLLILGLTGLLGGTALLGWHLWGVYLQAG